MHYLVKYFTCFFLFLFFTHFFALNTFAQSCSFQVSPTSGNLTDVFTVTGNNCQTLHPPFDTRIFQLVIRTNTGQELSRIRMKLPVLDTPGSMTYTISNFITLDQIQRFFGGTTNFDLNLSVEEFRSLTRVGTFVIGTININGYANQVTCGSIVTNNNSALCPNNCRAQTRDNNTKTCGDSRGQSPPQQCNSVFFEPVRRSETEWRMTWLVDTNNLAWWSGNRDARYRAFVVRHNVSDVLARDIPCGELSPNEVEAGIASGQCDNILFQPGDVVQLIVENYTDCFGTYGRCPYVNNCSSNFIALSLTTPTLNPSLTPIPTSLFTIAPTFGATTPIPSGTYMPPPTNFQIQNCTVGGVYSNGILISEPGEQGVQTAFGCLPTSISGLTRFIFSIATGIGGGIAFLLILLGGMKIVMSTGDPKKLQEGRDLVTSAVVGLLVILFSVIILRIIGINILGIPGFGGSTSNNQNPPPGSGGSNTPNCYSSGIRQVANYIDPQISCCNGGNVIAPIGQNEHLISCN